MFPPKAKPVGDDPEDAAIDMMIVGDPAPVPEGEEGESTEDPQALLSRIESDLAQLRQLIPAS